MQSAGGTGLVDLDPLIPNTATQVGAVAMNFSKLREVFNKSYLVSFSIRLPVQRSDER